MEGPSVDVLSTSTCTCETDPVLIAKKKNNPKDSSHHMITSPDVSDLDLDTVNALICKNERGNSFGAYVLCGSTELF